MDADSSCSKVEDVMTETNDTDPSDDGVNVIASTIAYNPS